MYTDFVSFQYKIIKNKIVMLIVNTNKSFSVYFLISYSLTQWYSNGIIKRFS